MNLELAIELLKQLHHPLNEPGSSATVVGHPNPSLRRNRSVPIGIVMEHRFAFCHWVNFKQKHLQDSQAADDASFVAPDLISFDWHDDSGATDDTNENQLQRLNQADENEVSLFAWAGLHPLNDGHIRPAVWLNTIGNIYIVLKDWDDPDEDRDDVMKDRYGKDHHLFFFRTPRKMVKTFQQTNSGSGVIWDLDLDYLTQSGEVEDQQYSPLLSNRQIKAALSPKSEWMQAILSDLRGITIALEPTYTGGLAQSLYLFRQWEQTFFDSSLFAKKCKWKDDLFT